MLVGIRHPSGVVEGAEYAQEVAKHFPGKTQIFNPRTREEYIQAISKYKPSLKNHLILLQTHHELYDTATSEYFWRMAEIYFDNKGGSIFGVEPEKHNNLWVADLPSDPARVGKHANISAQRSINMKKIAGAAYYGRTSIDPHTLLVGMTPRLNSASGIATQVVTSLPESWAEHGNWWGVGFLSLTTDEKLAKVCEWLDESANFVALGEKAHEALERLEVKHAAVPMPKGNGRFKNLLTYPPYGIVMREAARYQENKLDWVP